MATDPATTVPTAPAVPAPDLFGYLHGSWDCARELTDRLENSVGSYTGTAEFRWAEGTEGTEGAEGVLIHAEEGELRWQGAVYPTSRVLRLEPQPDGTARVTFEDGRPFHTLDLSSGTWTAQHPCAEDHYTGTFEVLGPDHWRLCWTVTGPAKDTVMTSHYTRRRTVPESAPN